MSNLSCSVKNNDLVYIKFSNQLIHCQYEELWFTQGDKLTYEVTEAQPLNIFKVDPNATNPQQNSTTFEDLRYGDTVYLSIGLGGDINPCFGNWSSSIFGEYDYSTSKKGWKKAQWIIQPGPDSLSSNGYVIPGENIYLQSVIQPTAFMFYSGLLHVQLEGKPELKTTLQLIPLRSMYFIAPSNPPSMNNPCISPCLECANSKIDPLVYSQGSKMVLGSNNMITRQVLDPRAVVTGTGQWTWDHCGPGCPSLFCLFTIPFVSANAFITPYNNAQQCCSAIIACPSGYNCSNVNQICKDKQNQLWSCQATPRPDFNCKGPCWNTYGISSLSSLLKKSNAKSSSSSSNSILYFIIFVIVIFAIIFVIHRQKSN